MSEKLAFFKLTFIINHFNIILKVMCFLMQIEEDRIRLSGSGLFQAGMHLVPTVSLCQIKTILITVYIIIQKNHTKTRVLYVSFLLCSWWQQSLLI